MDDLIAAALLDPYGFVEKLAPAWAMPREAVASYASWLVQAARYARRRRAPEIFLSALDAIFSSAQLREDVLEEFGRKAREEAPARKDGDLRLLRERTAEVAASYTKLRRSGDKLVGLCPIHRERRPSFYIYPGGRFFCFGCGRSGDAANLVSLVEGIPLREAIRRVLGEVT